MRAKKGLALEADGGTLFLDEIGELPLALQVKLLRFLQEEEVRPVGDTRSVKVDVRVVAASARDLAQAVAAGQFREDLYWRLAVVEIRLPALRERPEDLEPLARHFLARFAPLRPEVRGLDFAPEALERAPGPPLAGQRARADARRGAGGGAGRRADHPARRTCPTRCGRRRRRRRRPRPARRRRATSR